MVVETAVWWQLPSASGFEGCTGKKQGCRLGENTGFMTGGHGTNEQRAYSGDHHPKPMRFLLDDLPQACKAHIGHVLLAMGMDARLPLGGLPK